MAGENKVSEAQKRASSRWEERNSESHKYHNAKRMARSFFRNHEKPGDLEEIE